MACFPGRTTYARAWRAGGRVGARVGERVARVVVCVSRLWWSKFRSKDTPSMTTVPCSMPHTLMSWMKRTDTLKLRGGWCRGDGPQSGPARLEQVRGGVGPRPSVRAGAWRGSVKPVPRRGSRACPPGAARHMRAWQPPAALPSHFFMTLSLPCSIHTPRWPFNQPRSTGVEVSSRPSIVVKTVPLRTA